MGIDINGKTYETDEEGYLINLAEWDEAVANVSELRSALSELQLIFDNWRYFTAEELERIRAHVAETWRLSSDRRWFAEAIRSPIDELFLRHALADDPNAWDELEKLIAGAGIEKQ